MGGLPTNRLCIKLRAEWHEDKEIVGRFLPRRGKDSVPGFQPWERPSAKPLRGGRSNGPRRVSCIFLLFGLRPSNMSEDT